HAIKRYVRIGCDVVEGSDIQKIKEKKPRVEMIAGISKYNFWKWPVGTLSEHIVARPLPHFGTSAHFFPAMITNLCNEKISRPDTKISTHTEPQSKWTMPVPKL
ncbi:1444_t:CDS:2, partial [Gigaspora rosea]